VKNDTESETVIEGAEMPKKIGMKKTIRAYSLAFQLEQSLHG